jgi:hypothetical protein
MNVLGIPNAYKDSSTGKNWNRIMPFNNSSKNIPRFTVLAKEKN